VVVVLSLLGLKIWGKAKKPLKEKKRGKCNGNRLDEIKVVGKKKKKMGKSNP